MVEIVEQLDLKALKRAYGTSGSAPFHPALLLSILVYGYATGVFSSRKLENATYDSVAFRFVAANEHPDHDTLNSFRKRFLKDIAVLMVQVLMIARTMGMLNLGRIATSWQQTQSQRLQAQCLELRAHQATGSTTSGRSQKTDGLGRSGG